MKKIVALLILVIVHTAFQEKPVTSADVITLVADEWCPYNCSPNTDTPGFMVEIAQYAFERAGHTIEYTIIPWSRAIQGTRTGRYDGIIGVGRDEAPDLIFPDHELGLAAHTFFVKQGTSWKYTGLDSLEQISLGVIKDYSYGNFYEIYIKPNEGNDKKIQTVTGETGLMQNTKKLLVGRIDALIEDRSVFQYFFKHTKIPNHFLEAGIAYKEKVYIAFSPIHSDAKKYAKILSNAMQELRANGKLNEILIKYSLYNWIE